GAVGVAEVGERLVAEHAAQPGEVARGLDRADLAEQLPGARGARRPEGLPRREGLLEARLGRVVEVTAEVLVLAGVVEARDRARLPDPARVEADHVVGLEQPLAEERPDLLDEPDARGARAAGIDEQRAAPLPRRELAGDADRDLPRTGLLPVERGAHVGALQLAALGPLERLGVERGELGRDVLG